LVDQWEAARRFGPDVLVYHPKTLGGLHIAERLRVPAVLSLPLPFFTPTRAFPIPFIGRWPFGGTLNRASYQVNRFTAVAYGGMINSFRRNVLGLNRMSRLTDYLHHSDGRPVPVLYAYSPVVVPVPPDYPAHAHVTGYWVLDGQRSPKPPTELVNFIDAGPPPIYVGFGSMGFGRNAIERGRAVVQAVTNAGLRAVVATGWGGLRVKSPSERIYVVDQVPHDWLFPHMAAVVHHGGAGTTAAGLRAGRPTLICPVVGDQGFWGERVRALGIGPAPLPIRRLTVAGLTSRLLQLTSTHEYPERAAALARQLATEEGVSTAIRVIETLETAMGRGT
jgi:sterol 3beta-glucosyltransferase